jgi:hypothetical protein
MCRSIKALRSLEGTATDVEVREAALQFVRKVSGIRKPSSQTEAAFEDAVANVTAITEQLLRDLPPSRAKPPQPSRRRARA